MTKSKPKGKMEKEESRENNERIRIEPLKKKLYGIIIKPICMEDRMTAGFYKTWIKFSDVESACIFYLRYKDNPKLFCEEQFRIGFFHQRFEYYVSDESLGLVKYNDWLFRFTFSDIFRNQERGIIDKDER